MHTAKTTAQAMGEAAALPGKSKTEAVTARPATKNKAEDMQKTNQQALTASIFAEQPAVVWVPCVLTSSHCERIDQHYDTPERAMEAAEHAAKQNPAAIGVSCMREVLEEVAHAL